MGHQQTVQNQIGRRRMRRLISLLTVCVQNVTVFKFEWKLTTQQPLNSKWIRPIDKGGEFH